MQDLPQSQRSLQIIVNCFLGRISRSTATTSSLWFGYRLRQRGETCLLCRTFDASLNQRPIRRERDGAECGSGFVVNRRVVFVDDDRRRDRALEAATRRTEGGVELEQPLLTTRPESG